MARRICVPFILSVFVALVTYESCFQSAAGQETNHWHFERKRQTHLRNGGTPYPEQIHLHPSQDPSQGVTAVFVIASRDPSHIDSCGCRCRLRRAGTRATLEFAAVTRSYSEDGFEGTVLITDMSGLEPHSAYSFHCGCNGIWSQLLSFRTAPLAGNSNEAGETVKVVCWGDMGTRRQGLAYLGRDSSSVMESLEQDIKTGDYSLAIALGDNSYADGYPWPNAHVLDRWYSEMEGVMANVQTAIVPGNHEIQYNFAPYLARTAMPQPRGGTPGKLSRFYSSFDFGPLHIIAISTEHDVSKGSEQGKFLARDLASVDRTKTPWVIVCTHHPMYCTSKIYTYNSLDPRCTEDAQYFQESMEELFLGRVDLYLSGHNHQYESSHPLYSGELVDRGRLSIDGSRLYMEPKAPIYIVNGAAGNREGSDPSSTPNPGWRAATGDPMANGYGRLEANETALIWTYVETRPERIRDKFTILKHSRR